MNDSSWIFTLLGGGLVVWLYVRFYVAVIRTERSTKETAEILKRLVQIEEAKAYRGVA